MLDVTQTFLKTAGREMSKIGVFSGANQRKCGPVTELLLHGPHGMDGTILE